MTHRHELDAHRHKLSEIRNIMYSMKTLAMMETHKLERYIQAQSAIATTIENMAKDFLHFYPEVLPEAELRTNIVLLIGSERGFCGNFNERVLQNMHKFLTNTINNNVILIAIGQKLHSLVQNTGNNIVYIEGADVAEDIYQVVNDLAKTLASFQQTAALYAIHNRIQHQDLVIEKLLPTFADLRSHQIMFTNSPIINLKPKELFLDLTDHYLYSALHRVLYVSLMAENQRRIEHLENATQHLDDKTEELGLKINALRQEEIIEEIEVILLNASIR